MHDAHNGEARASDANVANLLGALATLLGDEVAGAVAPEPAELPQRTALACIARHPGCSIEQLRGPLALSHSGCVRLVDRLVAEGLVARRPGADARAVSLVLTRRGRAAAAEGFARREAALRRIFGVLSAAERAQLARIAAKLLDHGAPTPQTIGRTCRLCDHEACAACPFRARHGDGG